MGNVFDGFLSTSQGLDAFGDKNFVAAMLRFEAALTRAQADAGLVPPAAALSIIGTCKVDLFDTQKIVRESARAGSLAIPMVKALKEAVALFNPDAVAYVHLGSTSQDVIDTAMALIAKDLLAVIESDLHACALTLLSLCERYADTPILARTLMQPASVTSFGLKCAHWAAPMVRSLGRIRAVKARALQVQLGGAVGTLSRMQGKGAEITRLVAAELGLTAPAAPWHTQRDEWVALACELGLMTGSLGKLGKDISLLSQFEVGEVAEPHEAGRGGSSDMEHKRNPVASMTALAAAQRAPQRVAAMLATMPQEQERALGAWQAELAECSQLFLSAVAGVHAMSLALPGLQVHPQRMLDNIQAVALSQPHVAVADTAHAWFDSALAVQAGVQARCYSAALQAEMATLRV